MKKIVYYIAVAFLAINFSTCSDFLDLPSKSKTDSESVFSSIDKAEMAVLACYTGVWMQDAWYKAQNGTDEMWSTESNSNANNYAANYVLNDQSCPTGIYTTSYSSIERCNSCLKGLRAMSLSGEDERKCHIYIAECLAVRATCFLNLIRYFGDVPYSTVPVLPICKKLSKYFLCIVKDFSLLLSGFPRMLLMDYWPVQLFMQQVMLCIGI